MALIRSDDHDVELQRKAGSVAETLKQLVVALHGKEIPIEGLEDASLLVVRGEKEGVVKKMPVP